MKRVASGIIILLIVALLVWLLPACAKPADTEIPKMDVRMGTSGEGTSGYAAGAGLAASITKRAPHVQMDAMPTAGSVASTKLMCKGDLEMAYGMTATLNEAWTTTGAFKDAPAARMPLQGWWWYGTGFCPYVKADRTDIKSYRDLTKVKFYNGMSGGTYFQAQRVWEALGIWNQMQLRDIGTGEIADAMQMGTVDVVVLNPFCNGKTANTLSMDVDARIDLKPVVPTPEEIAIIQKLPLLTFHEITTDWMRPENRARAATAWAGETFIGFHATPDMGTQYMYEIEKAWIEYAKEDLAPVMKLLEFYSADPLAAQVTGIDEARDVPVHPGVAKYLKEKGVWKDYWKIGELSAGVK